MSLYHVKTQTVPDSTATSLVRPSDWNSAHVQGMTISGNTAGQSSFTGTNIVFQGGNNVTLSANTAANAATVIISAGAGGGGVALSAGTNSTSTGTVVFANSNGLTFGMDTNGAVTGSYTVPTVPTDYMSTSERGNYFYTSNNTFANSTHSHGNIAFSGTNVSATFTTASNGLSIQLSAPTVGGAQTGVSGISAGTTQATSGTVVFSNSNGVSFGVNGNTLTASHNGLTTAAQSNHSHGVTLNLTNLSGTTGGNSNGITISLSANPAGGADGYNIIGVNGNSVGSAATVQFSNSNNVTFGLNGSTITASASYSQSTQPAVGLNTAATNVTWTVNSSGISLNAGAYLTTAAQSNHSHNLATTTTNGSQIVIATTNSNGATMAVPPFITTFTQPGATVFSNSNNVSFGLNGSTVTATATFAQSNQTANFYVQGNTTQLSSTAGVDLRSVSFEGAGIASVGVSNGRVLVSVPTGGGAGDGYNIVAMGTDPVGGGSTSGATFSTLSGSIFLQAGNNVTLSQTSNSINISGADVKWSLVGNTAGTNSSNLSANSFYFSGGPNITLSGNSNTIVVSAAAGGGGGTESNYFPHKDALWAVGQIGQNSIQVQPLANVPVVSYDRLAYGVQFSGATNSTMTVSATVGMGLYTLNGSTLSLLTSGSGSFSINGSGTANSTINSGPRWATMTMNAGGSFSGDVWIAFRSSTATAGVNATVSNLMASRINSSWSGFIGVGTANSVQSLPGMGFYSTTSNAMPSSMALSHITGVSSLIQRPQVFFMTNGALPI